MSTQRVQSATGRLQGTTARPHPGLPPKRGLRRTGAYGGDSFMQTKYDLDFSAVSPEEVELCTGKQRASSPTRRNKPHPSKTFIRWTGKVVDPNMDSGMEVQIKPEEMHAERQWYTDDFREMSGKPVTEDDASKVMGTFQRMRLPYDSSTNTVYGHFTHGNRSRGEASHAAASRPPAETARKKGTPVSRGSLQRAMRDTSTLPVLEGWLKDASPQEQHTILSMMTAAEKSVLSKATKDHMQPQAMPAIEEWMRSARPHEREVAAKLFDSLSGNQRPPTSALPRTSRHSNRGQRSLSEGATQRQAAARNVTAMHSRRYSHADINAPMLWHLKSDRDPEPQVVHRGSIFMPPHRYRGHEFAIHPEWPTYQE